MREAPQAKFARTISMKQREQRLRQSAATNPLKTYKRVAAEILRRMPDKSIHPVEAAEAVRSYLMLRFGMHLGLPHGPHAVRDVLATHVIKQTASYDLAAFAVQDTARTIKEFYGRFLPEEKIGLVSKLLNKAWQGR